MDTAFEIYKIHSLQPVMLLKTKKKQQDLLEVETMSSIAFIPHFRVEKCSMNAKSQFALMSSSKAFAISGAA